jgi:hypothetical protein
MVSATRLLTASSLSWREAVTIIGRRDPDRARWMTLRDRPCARQAASSQSSSWPSQRGPGEGGGGILSPGHLTQSSYPTGTDGRCSSQRRPHWAHRSQMERRTCLLFLANFMTF